jgi:hypothetical protein
MGPLIFGRDLANFGQRSNPVKGVFRILYGGSRSGSGRGEAGLAYLGRMRHRDLYSRILGISAPWHVTDVLLDAPAGKVEVVVEQRGEARCPKCGMTCPGYDPRRRRWEDDRECLARAARSGAAPASDAATSPRRLLIHRRDPRPQVLDL